MILFQLYGTTAGRFKVICSGWVNTTLLYNRHIGRRTKPNINIQVFSKLSKSFQIKKCWYYINIDAISFIVANKGEKTQNIWWK